MVITLVPRFVKTVATFAAPDPWNHDQPTSFNLDAYVRVPETNPNIHVSPNMRMQNYLLAIRSEIDGQTHLLPEALAELWRQKGIRDARLPAVLHQIEPQLGRKDFLLYLANTWMLKGWAIFGAAAFLALAALIWSARDYAPDPFMIPIMTAISVVLALLTAAIGFRLVSRRKARRLRQLEGYRSLA